MDKIETTDPDAILKYHLRFPLGGITTANNQQITVNADLFDIFKPQSWTAVTVHTTDLGDKISFSRFADASKNKTSPQAESLDNKTVGEVIAAISKFVLDACVDTAVALHKPPSVTAVALKTKLVNTNPSDFKLWKDRSTAFKITELDGFEKKHDFIDILSPYIALRYVDFILPNQADFVFVQRLATLTKMYICLRVSEAMSATVFRTTCLNWIYKNTLALSIIDDPNEPRGLDDIFSNNVKTSKEIKDNAAKVSSGRKQLNAARDNWDTMAVGNEDSYAFRKRTLRFFYATVAMLCVQIVGLFAAGFYGNDNIYIIIASIFIVVPMIFEAYGSMRSVFSIAESTSMSNWAPPV